MPIEFDYPESINQARRVLKTVAEEMMRPRSRYFDEHEHEIPWDYIEFMHRAMRSMRAGTLAPETEGEAAGQSKTPIGYQLLASQIESIAWGDLGMYHCLP